jgi:hypothetical protein
MSKSAVASQIEALVQTGMAHRTIANDGRGTYLYQLTASKPKVLRRADGQLARWCSCTAYVRFKHYKGTWIFNCRKCGLRYFDDDPIGG